MIVEIVSIEELTLEKVHYYKNCYRHFEKANGIAVKINQTIIEGFIETDEENKEILIEEDLILLYNLLIYDYEKESYKS